MPSNDSSIWRCFHRTRRKEQRRGRWEKGEKEGRKKRGGEGRESEMEPMHNVGYHRRKVASFSVSIPESPLKLGLGNLTVCSLSPPSLSQVRLFLAWFIWAICVTGSSVCHLPVLACSPFVLPQPSSSTCFP